MDTPQDPTPPQESHTAVDPTQPTEPAPGTVLPSEESALAERGDEQFVSGEGGEGGEPYDGGEIPAGDTSSMTEQEHEARSETTQTDENV